MQNEITIWDNDTGRSRIIERNLCQALKNLGLHATVKIITEPPLISRENLLHRVPVLEIFDHYWSLRPQAIITESQCQALLVRLFQSGSNSE